MLSITIDAQSRVLSIAGQTTLPGFITVESIPEGGVLGELWYIASTNTVVKTEDLTAEQLEELGGGAAEEEDTGETETETAETPSTTRSLATARTAARVAASPAALAADYQEGVLRYGAQTAETDEDGNGEDGGEGQAETVSFAEGNGMLATLRLSPSGFALRDGQYVYAVNDANITPSCVLNVLSVNRGALRDDLSWESGAGVLTFTADARPSEPLDFIFQIMDTGEETTAAGAVEQWPAAGWKVIRYLHSLHEEGFSLTLTSRGTDDASKTLETKLDLSGAELMFMAAEWTGNSHVMIPHFYVNGAGRLCVTLTNTADTAVVITELALRVLYSGTVSGYIVPTGEQLTFLNGYITDNDIDELEA